MKGMLTMSQREADRIEIIKKIEANQLRIEEGAGLIGISQRQVCTS